jgi:hypothetical protein
LHILSEPNQTIIEVSYNRMTEQNFTTEELNNETWLPVAGYEGLYSVSNLGRIRGERIIRAYKTPRILKQQLNKIKGYLQVGLSRNNKGRTCTVHPLVATAFLGNPPSSKHEVNHKDACKTNNRVENLEWCLHIDNIRHKKVMNTELYGDARAWAKLKNTDIPIIRQLLNSGKSHTKIAKIFGVSATTIGHIYRGKKWVNF